MRTGRLVVTRGRVTLEGGIVVISARLGSVIDRHYGRRNESTLRPKERVYTTAERMSQHYGRKNESTLRPKARNKSTSYYKLVD